MPMLMGMGITPFVQNLEKVMKMFSGNMGASGKKAAQQPAGPQGAPMGMPSMPAPQGAAPASSGIDPMQLFALQQMLASRGAQ
jgi:hypothetical protein